MRSDKYIKIKRTKISVVKTMLALFAALGSNLDLAPEKWQDSTLVAKYEYIQINSDVEKFS